MSTLAPVRNRDITAPVRPFIRVWRLLAGTYRGIEESSLWGRLLLGNVWPAYLFALPLIGKVWIVGNKFKAGPGQEDPLHFQAQLAQDVVTVIFFTLVVALYAIRAPVKGKRASWRGGLVALAGTFLLNLVGFLPIPNIRLSTEGLLVSTAIVVAGTLFTTWGLLTLGRCFGMFPEARGLVTGGPYRWVRHPVYVGEIISAFGLIIARPHVAIVVFYVAFIGLQYWRSLYEDDALAETFPDQYPAYKSRTGRLLPRWRQALVTR